MLEKVLNYQKTSMFLTDTSEDMDAYFQYIASKKIDVFSKWKPLDDSNPQNFSLPNSAKEVFPSKIREEKYDLQMKNILFHQDSAPAHKGNGKIEGFQI